MKHIRQTTHSTPGLDRRCPKPEGGLDRHSPKGDGGFTLIELIAVLAIMGTLFTVGVVGFNHFGRGQRLGDAGRAIGRQLEYARQFAINHRAMYGVEFDRRNDPERDRYRIYYEDSGKVTVNKWIELPLGIEFGSVVGVPADPPTEITFQPSGRAVTDDDEFMIHDTDTEKESLIEVELITGRAKVSTPSP